MPNEICYLCGNAIPTGQSLYEDHGVKVCLKCFKTTERCKKCRFPSNHLKMVDGFGTVCEFCYQSFIDDVGRTCYLCNGKIWSRASHYSDHGKVVCQSCFQNATVRCFTCRFPHAVEKIHGQGGVCEFCKETNLIQQSDIGALLTPLKTFLQQYGHEIRRPPKLLWVDWKLVLGMQLDDMGNIRIKFFDELVRYCYPVYFMKNLFYIIPSIPQQWFMPYMASQLASADICRKYKLSHLRGTTPFLEMARGWCHWIAYSTAKILKYDKIAKTINRWPESSLPGNFSKFQAMSEFRKTKEIIEFGQQTLKEYADRYL